MNKAGKIAIFFYEDGSRGRDVLTNFLDDSELKSFMTDGYNAYVFIGAELSLLYKLEDRYDEEGISPTERGKRRQSLETKEIMIRLRSNLDAELAKEETDRSPYLTEALNYLKKFWNGICTVKLHGMSSWHFLGEFFQKIFSGCRDFLSMTPLNIGLAYSKC